MDQLLLLSLENVELVAVIHIHSSGILKLTRIYPQTFKQGKNSNIQVNGMDFGFYILWFKSSF